MAVPPILRLGDAPAEHRVMRFRHLLALTAALTTLLALPSAASACHE